MSKKKQKKLTVRELKEYLAQFPDDAEICGETSPDCVVTFRVTKDRANADVVFIGVPVRRGANGIPSNTNKWLI